MIFVNKGDVPLTDAQLGSRTQSYIDRDWPTWKRERSVRLQDNAFNTYMAQVALDTDVNRANNLFNQQLVNYTKAVERLNRYELSKGQAEVIEQQPTGEQVLDEATGLMVDVMVDVVVKPFIEPLPALVDEQQYDEVTGTVTTIQVANPLITNDEQERLLAQTIINTTPIEVITYYESNISVL